MNHITIALSVAGIVAVTTGLLLAFKSNPYFVGQSTFLPWPRLLLLWYIKAARIGECRLSDYALPIKDAGKKLKSFLPIFPGLQFVRSVSGLSSLRRS